MIEEHVPPDCQNDHLYECFMEPRARHLNNPSRTDEHYSFTFPKEPLEPTSSTDPRKRFYMHSRDSEINSPLAFFRSQALSAAIPFETSTPIHLLRSTPKLPKLYLKDLLAGSNNMCSIVPNCALKSLHKIARNPITPILNQY